MAARSPKTVKPGNRNAVHAAGRHPAGSGDDDCRCKETAKMTPRQLFGLMLSDLAFWKKSKQG